MVEIQHQTAGGRYAPVTMGTKYLKVGDRQIDVAARQADEAVAIDLSLDRDGRIVESGGRWYVANVVLPPARYEYVATDRTDPETGEPIMERVRASIEKNLIQVNLWALPAEVEGE